jgi:hypothetical protein
VRSGRTQLWVHVTCTAWLTLLHVGRRNKATVEAGPLGDYHGTIVHDRLAMYFGYGGGHVLCNAHVLRSLHALLSSRTHREWAAGFIELICDTKTRADTARVGDEVRSVPASEDGSVAVGTISVTKPMLPRRACTCTGSTKARTCSRGTPCASRRPVGVHRGSHVAV